MPQPPSPSCAASMEGESVDLMIGTCSPSLTSSSSFPSHGPICRSIWPRRATENALRVCGQVADGLMISNMKSSRLHCSRPPTGGRRCRERRAGRCRRPLSNTYLASIRPDRTEARQSSRRPWGQCCRPIGRWGRMASDPGRDVARSAVPEEEFVAAVNRIKAGENPTSYWTIALSTRTRSPATSTTASPR